MFKTRSLGELNIVVHIGSGEIGLDQIVQVASSWQASPAFQPETGVVWDIADATLLMDWQEIKATVPQLVPLLGCTRSASSRTAWVTTDEVVEVILDCVYMAYDWPTEWKVFTEAEPAVTWVRGGHSFKDVSR